MKNSKQKPWLSFLPAQIMPWTTRLLKHVNKTKPLW